MHEPILTPPDFEFVRADSQFADVIAAHRHFQPEVTLQAKQAYAEWVRGAMERGAYHGWFAMQAGSIVGGVGLVLLDWGPTRDDLQSFRARIVNVWVDPSVRRQGVARALTSLALESARDLDIRTVSLSSTSLSRSLYESLGFTTAVAEMTCKIS